MMADGSAITAIAALAGSVVGGLTSFATTYVTQTHQSRRERVARELERREALYADFIERAASLFLDSIDKSLDDPSRLVHLIAVMARIRLTGSPRVLESAESVMHEIIASYQRPPRHPREIFAQTDVELKDPLSEFTSACRAERDAMLSLF